MAVTKKIEIDGKEVEFRASAAVPRMYRIKFGRDIYKDLRSLEKSVDENDEEESSMDLFSLEMFENIAFIMAKHAAPDNHGGCKKKPRKSEREMTTALFMLRCVQLGLSIQDLDLLTIGMVEEMMIESQNDSYPYKQLASQSDMDKF